MVDLSLSTAANHRPVNGAEVAHVGRYAGIRSALDTSYHGLYTHDRQLVQDALVQRNTEALEHLPPVETPWIVFTAGAFGAG